LPATYCLRGIAGWKPALLYVVFSRRLCYHPRMNFSNETQPDAPPENTPRDGRLKRAQCLFTAFAKMGAFTFGGGYAMLPLIEREVVEKRKWATHAEVLDMYAISQTAPGVIALNFAVFLGFRVGGILGAIAAVVGVALPSVVFITLVAIFFEHFKGNPWVQSAFAGVRAAVLVLCIGSLRKLAKPVKATVFNFAVGFAALAASLIFGKQIGMVWLILTAVAVGLFADILTRSKKEKTNA